MPRSRTVGILILVVFGVFAGETTAGSAPAGATAAPLAVSPGHASKLAVIGDTCPTFSWSSVARAGSYELLVYRMGEAGAEERPVVEERFAGSVSSWTPSLARCLERGGRYAWSVRALAGDKTTEWSAPSLFEVAPGPGEVELERALIVVRDYLESQAAAELGSARPAAAYAPGERATARAAARPSPGPEPAPLAPVTATALDVDGSIDHDGEILRSGTIFAHAFGGSTYENTALGLNALEDVTPGAPLVTDGKFNTAVGFRALADSTSGTRNAALGATALTSNTTGKNNTAVGNSALKSNTDKSSNTAVGIYALKNNASGSSNTGIGANVLEANDGSFNAAIGANALKNNTSGHRNAAGGYAALRKNETGYRNVALGPAALYNNLSGHRNIALGNNAGINATTGSDNIFIGNSGVAGDAALIKIGAAGTHTATYVAGITGTTTNVADAVAVLIDSAGQLGTVNSSLRYKEDIRDIVEDSEKLLALRPVTFRYKKTYADGSRPIQYGLIAEEVAAAFPDLVVYDELGRPRTVKYHLLGTLLLNELQKLHSKSGEQADLLAWQSEEIARLRTRLAALSP